MTKDDMAMVAMEIVAYAGDARTKYLEAMDAMGDEDFAKAEALIKEGDDLILDAHNQQTELITKEAAGEQLDIGFLTVHAQDHLMTAMLLSDMDKRFLKILKKKAGKEDGRDSEQVSRGLHLRRRRRVV